VVKKVRRNPARQKLRINAVSTLAEPSCPPAQILSGGLLLRKAKRMPAVATTDQILGISGKCRSHGLSMKSQTGIVTKGRYHLSLKFAPGSNPASQLGRLK
jgi:hypothetical protein